MVASLEVKTNSNLEKRMLFLREFGSRPTSYFTTQPGVSSFFLDTCGYIAYERFDHGLTTLYGLCPETFVLADPVCSSGDKSKLIKSFLKEFPNSSFLEVSKDTAKILEGLDYKINPIGVEVNLDIQNYNLKGNKMRDIRKRVIHSEQHNLCVSEHFGEDEYFNSIVNEISDEWRKGKKSKKELRFLTRPFVLGEEVDVRRFSVSKDNELIGYSSFDPIYSCGNVIGYTANIIRIKEDTPHGTSDIMVLDALNKFKQEGKSVLSLGYSPLANLNKVEDMKTSKSLDLFLNFLYNNMNGIYSFKGLYFHKSRYRGSEEKVYLATKNNFPILSSLRAFGLCNVF